MLDTRGVMTMASGPVTNPRSTGCRTCIFRESLSYIQVATEQALRTGELLVSSLKSYERVCLSITVTLSRKTMMGVSKGTRSSDSWGEVFIRKVREIEVTVNWSISMLVVGEGY